MSSSTRYEVSSKYPRNVNINFNKLSTEALLKVGEYYGIDKNQVASKKHDDIAALVAKKFESFSTSENDVLNKFAAQYCRSDAEPSKSRKRQKTGREILDSEPARVGEQVAAKVLQTNENGSWILGNVTGVDESNSSYIVQDEDDESRTSIVLSFQDVRRLEDAAAHLRRGDSVLAVFPETTSFYRGSVVKNPKVSAHGGSSEVIVRFEDDEDETGKAPPRRIPARFVLRREDVEQDDDEDEDDNE